jgi:hypothetical protein
LTCGGQKDLWKQECFWSIKTPKFSAPTITKPAINLLVECDGSGNMAELNAWLSGNGGATASSKCSSVTWSNNFDELAFIGEPCSRSVDVTFIATDECGNEATTTATFNIIDTSEPTITKRANSRFSECDGTGNLDDLNDWLISNGEAQASDQCSGGDVTWSNNYDGTIPAPCKSVVVDFKVTDQCGNENESSAPFTIVDEEPPTITQPASSLEVECDGMGNIEDLDNWLASSGGAEASDSCSSVTWSNNFDELAFIGEPCSRSVDVTFIATDECGNEATTTATFSII